MNCYKYMVVMPSVSLEECLMGGCQSRKASWKTCFLSQVIEFCFFSEVHRNHLGSDPVGLGWSLQFCSSYKLPGGAEALSRKVTKVRVTVTELTLSLLSCCKAKPIY